MVECPRCGRPADILVDGYCEECGPTWVVDTIEDLRPE